MNQWYIDSMIDIVTACRSDSNGFKVQSYQYRIHKSVIA
jgi:hypothetical protein